MPRAAGRRAHGQPVPASPNPAQPRPVPPSQPPPRPHPPPQTTTPPSTPSPPQDTLSLPRLRASTSRRPRRRHVGRAVALSRCRAFPPARASVLSCRRGPARSSSVRAPPAQPLPPATAPPPGRRMALSRTPCPTPLPAPDFAPARARRPSLLAMDPAVAARRYTTPAPRHQTG